MENKDKLITYIESDPDLYKIINSKEHILILELIGEKSIDIEELSRKTDFKKVSILYNILDNLLDKKYIKKLDVNKNKVYYITDEGKIILNLVKSAQKEFNLLIGGERG
jgi:DNA-binding PadR family transcriptional regulator